MLSLLCVGLRPGHTGRNKDAKWRQKQTKKQMVQATVNPLGKSAAQGRTLGPSNLVSVQEMKPGIDDTHISEGI